MITAAFNREGEKSEGSSKIDFLEAIRRERPDLREKEPSFPPGQGQKAYTVIFGNEVFKGPKHPYGEYLDDFNTECKYLKLLEGSGLPVPRITTIGKDFLIVGMDLMPGDVMPSVHSSKLTMDEQRTLVKELIDFVIKMAHHLPLQGEKFAMHDDLWNANILIDSESKRLTGVIDFGKVAYKRADEWEPMYDFDGSAFYDMLQKEFNHRKGELPGPIAQQSSRHRLSTHNLHSPRP